VKTGEIKVGNWYEASLGSGRCLAVEGSGARINVVIDVVRPIPRGRCNVRPRDVVRQIEPIRIAGTREYLLTPQDAAGLGRPNPRVMARDVGRKPAPAFPPGWSVITVDGIPHSAHDSPTEAAAAVEVFKSGVGKDTPADQLARIQVEPAERFASDEGCDCGADRTGPSAEAHAADCPASGAWTQYGPDLFRRPPSEGSSRG
jgi:hypothetical protein